MSAFDYYNQRRHADNTRMAYRTSFRQFREWCAHKGVRALPCEESTLAEYLADLADRGFKVSTIGVRRAAIDRVHLDRGYRAPGTSLEVRNVVAGISRTIGTRKEQKRGITAEVFAQMLEHTAQMPEQFETLTIVAVMRDALLRGSELIALRVADFTPMPDGTGRVEVLRSKTDQTGEGAVQFLSEQTTAMVARHLALRGRRDGYLFGRGSRQMPIQTLARKIKKLAALSELPHKYYSTHSCRIGMAQDLIAAGGNSVAVATAGRWEDTKMVVYYTRNQSAGESAVAQYYAR